MELGDDTKVVILAAGAMFILALVLGIWKYRGMATPPDHLAHPYVDIAHRAALLYSFATILVAVFVQFSGWSEVRGGAAREPLVLHRRSRIGDARARRSRRVSREATRGRRL